LTIGDDGMLSDPRLWAETGRPTPDGICLDADGAVWMAGLSKCQFARIQPGGQVDRVISTGRRWALACVLGGPRRQTLFMTTCAEAPRQQPDVQGRVEMIAVDVPGAGWP
jgi:sugar lactone lactonase YvrE